VDEDPHLGELLAKLVKVLSDGVEVVSELVVFHGNFLSVIAAAGEAAWKAAG
jgi:hypothetical protein